MEVDVNYRRGFLTIVELQVIVGKILQIYLYLAASHLGETGGNNSFLSHVYT